MAKSVGVDQAKAHFSRLLSDVAGGEEIVITRRGRPVARLMPVESPTRTFGGDRGAIFIADDFDAPLPAELGDAFKS